MRVVLLLVFPALLICGCRSVDKNPPCQEAACPVAESGSPPARSSSIDDAVGISYTPTMADIQQVLDLFSWAFDLTEHPGSIEIGLLEDGTFQSLVTPRGNNIRILFQRIRPNEGRLIVIGGGGILHKSVKQLGVFHRSYAVPRPIENHFELIKFSSDPGEHGWPQILVVRVNKTQ